MSHNEQCIDQKKAFSLICGGIRSIGVARGDPLLLRDDMPVSKPRKYSPPINLGKNPQQVNGLYVHFSPPKVFQFHSSVIRQWLRTGDLNQLEQLVLDGHGHKLVGEYSADPKVRSFIKQIPAFLIKTKKLQDAIVKGDLKQLQKLLSSTKSQESPLKNIHLSKNQAGLGLLHKAVYYGHPHIVDFLVSNFPQSIKMVDKDGKTPLHYCGASKEAGKIWPILIKAGADATVKDSKGKHPAYYMERSNEIQLPEEKILNGISVNPTHDRNNLIIKPSNIRIWIHDRDIKKLQQVIWEGHGGKLKVETSKHPKVKRFLEGIPYILNLIKDVHSSVIRDDLDEFVKKTSHPVPADILGSKDINGLTPLHKAAGLNRRKIAENILERNSNLVFSVDQEGKTPLHYAAALKDDGEMYNLLTRNFSDEKAVDKNGKLASYYKTNPKEIPTKILEVIPEAPRTSTTFPQTFDWSLYHPDNLTPIGNSLPSKNSPVERVEENQSCGDIRETETGEPHQQHSVFKRSESEEKTLTGGTENSTPPEEPVNRETEEIKEIKSFDIWTNDLDNDDGNKKDSFTGYDDEDDVHEYDRNVTPKHEEENLSRDKDGGNDSEEGKNAEESATEKEYPSANPASDHSEGFEEQETNQKTEREIAEERQRLLDEGLLKVATENDEIENEESKLIEAIEAGDMETLASMVLNGEGHKLRGKSSDHPEVQSFLDNIPVYMSKITALHEAARHGSLKNLQAALDRRKFATAKESFDKSGATPLHAAVIFENTPIIKYLGERFPETLVSTDNFGRTPLHYAAILRNDGLIYNTLLDLGANPNTKDNEGNTAVFYKNNWGEMTREKLLEEMNLSYPVKNERVNNPGISSPMTDPSIHDVEPEISFDEGIPLSRSAGNGEEEDDNNESNNSQSSFSLTDRDEYGQSILHFAAARAHGRGGLFQLIHESGVNLGYRDELYRTARDIAQEANITENINEIDKYVISLAAKGETGKLVELFLEGYDHILDLEDEEGNDITKITSSKGHDKTLAFLKAIPALEEKRERIHGAVRAGDCDLIEAVTSKSKNVRFLIIGKNSSGRCSLHVAILYQKNQVAELISQKFPETLKIGDNLERTPLHYAMGVEEVETLSKILIKCGAKRVVKDLKGRQPTYYFMNRTEILKLQEEEIALKFGNNFATV